MTSCYILQRLRTFTLVAIYPLGLDSRDYTKYTIQARYTYLSRGDDDDDDDGDVMNVCGVWVVAVICTMPGRVCVCRRRVVVLLLLLFLAWVYWRDAFIASHAHIETENTIKPLVQTFHSTESRCKSFFFCTRALTVCLFPPVSPILRGPIYSVCFPRRTLRLCVQIFPADTLQCFECCCFFKHSMIAKFSISW